MQWLACAVVAGMAVLLWKRRPAGFRACMALLAACWLWVAVAFFHQHYSILHWAAHYMAAASAAQALWLLVMAAWPTTGATPWRSGLFARAFGMAVFMVGAIAPWAVALFRGQPWMQLELPGLMPDPTAIMT